MLSEWKESYIAYENLQSRWPTEVFPLLNELVYSAEAPEYWLNKYSTTSLEKSLLAEAKRVRSIFNNAMRRLDDVRKPFADVYHAAIYLASNPRFWSCSGYAYRGQRDLQWPMKPTLFRPPKDETELTHEEFSRRLNTLATYSEALDAQYPARFGEYQRIAIGQHYGLQTWLLDLTSDPLVALFFASDRGKAGDVGVVTRFSRIEWDWMSASGENCLGAMTLIEVPGVPRIEAQKALFLNGSHPDLIFQYGAQQILFVQKDGLVFESKYTGITREKLLSDTDDFATFTTTWLGVEHPLPFRPLGVHPLDNATRPLKAADYRDILQTLIATHHLTHQVTAEVDKVLHFLCNFHLELQNPVYAEQFGSIHLLIGAAERALANQKLETIVNELYTNHVKPAVLEQVLGKLRSSYGKSAFDGGST